MKALLLVALLASTLAAAPAATSSPAPAASPSAVPVDTATPAPRIDLRSATNPVRKRELADAHDVKKHAAAANKLCLAHGFGALYAFRREVEEDGWLILCNPKTGKPTNVRQLPALLVDRL